ncbi:dTDP-4-dehydrorhamnose 3,5-epimerase [Pedobacter flavus]|uniref:dTDP-4-dehydrorhamnose 3,5-epimerase n=1 Tax=Pedobacter flavus TaxID=3113906 RepID=A0ABU7H0S4_9SPHI|nr:dTDP-4-dehydrorhamnose 3,5-epimerase [Pedobacter sp. VNH31]MEE1884687.1 dTDP-4-dehydrorhamnose 3,5-epimerase [Pedobacter sp. VNH31]
MQVVETELKGCYIINPTIVEDERGYFFESFNQKKFEQLTGESGIFVQDNQSNSSYGVVRGLHAQRGEFAQAKLVRVLSGKVLDIAVDVRPNSPTFGKYVAIELSSENKKQLYVPRGFLHGFSVLSESVDFFYKCDNFYNKESEYGVIYNDKDLNIDWKVPTSSMLLSAKDVVLGSLKDLKL